MIVLDGMLKGVVRVFNVFRFKSICVCNVYVFLLLVEIVDLEILGKIFDLLEVDLRGLLYL